VGPEEKAKILESAVPGLVIVEYTVKYDKGEAPYGYGRYAYLIKEERPVEESGFLLADDLVLTTDEHINPRFIEKIQVSFNDERVDAEIDRYATDCDAMFLKLKGKLEGAVPFTFDTSLEGPYFRIRYFETEARWHNVIAPFESDMYRCETGEFTRVFDTNCLVVNSEGVPVTISMKHELKKETEWKTDPLKWEAISAKEHDEGIARIKKLADNAIVRATLKLRSPKKKVSNRYGGGGDTEMHLACVIMDKRNILIPAKLSQKVTARLEKIILHLPDKKVEAEFKYTLLEYGGLIAAAKEDLTIFAEPFEGDIFDVKFKMLYGAEVRINGEQRIQYANRYRITEYNLGKHKEVYPELEGPDDDVFPFTPDGKLVAIQLSTREKGDSGGGRYSSGSGAGYKQYKHIKELMSDIKENMDPDNIPLSEENEDRLSWVGVELQSLNTELARFNNVSQYCNDGDFGGIVSYVYEGSPAARAGIKQGDIFLKVHVEGEPKPYNIEVSSGRWDRRPFPWSRLDELSEQYYDRIPPPWPSVATEFIRVLTDYGFDKKYKAEFFIDGKIVQKEMVIEETPPYYETAKKFKSESLGATVRNVTYEQRRYYQMKLDDPGVILSKIEPGSKISVAGIKPYEIITHINDEPIPNVKVFEEKLPKEGEFRLNIKRMTKSRVVKIKVEAEEEEEEEQAEE
ncbi:hypothetical protein ACFL4W_04680, partial [Planctomycetota bacterium]